MKTETQIDFLKAVELLKTAGWSYEHCGDRIKSGDMEEYISELKDALIEADDKVLSELLSDNINDDDMNDVDQLVQEKGVTNENALLMVMGDRIAQQYIDCVYPTVTFICHP
jgi:hypothetical protein